MSLFYHESSDEEDDLNQINNNENSNKDSIQLDFTSLKDEDDNANGTNAVKEDEEKSEYPLLPYQVPQEESHLPDSIAPISVTLNLRLPYQHQILQDLISTDNALLIMGAGLGLELITANLLHVLSAKATVKVDDKEVMKRGLVILLSANDHDNIRLQEELTELAWSEELDKDVEDFEDEEKLTGFHSIRSENMDMTKRRALYEQGGVMSVTSRIFIVDLLAGIVDPTKITGMVVLHPERITDLSNESFIVQIYRRFNKWGFVKALSESVEDFAGGFAPLTRKLKDLGLKKALLWPRFHIGISESLNTQDTRNVTEIKVNLTPSMKAIQAGLWGSLKKCIDEIRRENATLSTEYWSIEHALDSKFIASFYVTLSPSWHLLTAKTKQLLKDIQTLKSLLYSNLNSDCIDFKRQIDLITESNHIRFNKTNSMPSLWLETDESAAVLTNASTRIATEDGLVLEENPKWEQLGLLMEDINVERSIKGKLTGPVLILCRDERVRVQLWNYVSVMKFGVGGKSVSGRRWLMKKYGRYRASKEQRTKINTEISQATNQNQNQNQHQGQEGDGDDQGGDGIYISKAFQRQAPKSKRRRARGGSAVAAVGRLWSKPIDGGSVDYEGQIDESVIQGEIAALEQDDEVILVSSDEGEEEEEDEFRFEDNVLVDNFEQIAAMNTIHVETYSNAQTDPTLLTTLQPSFIIMYDPSLPFIRQIELYQVIHSSNPAKVFFMYYGDSIEEQTHLSEIKREKDCFTRLIREKAGMSERFETDQDSTAFQIKRSHFVTKKNTNTRIAGGANQSKVNDEEIVLVDTREFNASLPGLLFKIGLRVIPVQLTVGDYILNEKVCIERKSIPDLISSFNTGRLEDQCKRMSQHYDIPTLLIEFDRGESFSLEPFSENRHRRFRVGNQVSDVVRVREQEDIQLKLSKLTIKFPKLRIIWSSSPYRTAELILELKMGRGEPDVIKATNTGVKRRGKQTYDTSTGADDYEEEDEGIKKFYQWKVIDLIKDIPGLTQLELYSLLRKFKSSKKLLTMERTEMERVMNDEDVTEKVWEYLRSSYGSIA